MIYLDNAATTMMLDEALRKMNKIMSENYGNPSSIYEYGMASKGIVESARENIAATLNVKTEEIYFTSGGTEANNWAIIGTALSNKDKGRHIITSKVEHKSILKACELLHELGFEITYIDVDTNGIVDIDKLKRAIRTDTILISIMSINNELGSVMPIKEIGDIAKEKKVLFHTDAVQAYGHMWMELNILNIDMLSVSAHKFHGPKGIGFLYIKSGTSILPFINGGNQERGMRSGTENVAAIGAMAEAARKMYETIETDVLKIGQLRKLLYDEIQKRVDGIYTHIDYKKCTPYILSIVVKGVNAVCLVDALGQRGVCVSAGSACNSRELVTSHVLRAIGVSKENANSTIRLSLSKYSEREEIIRAAEIFSDVVRTLREIYGE